MTTTPYKGFGICPIGSVPFGYGSPATARPNIGAALTTTKGTAGNARLIDPRTKDYVIDPNTGRPMGDDGIRSMVYLALTTIKGTSTVTDLGNEFDTVKLKNEKTEAQLQDLTRQALAELVNQKLIRIESVVVNTSGFPTLKITFTNLKTSQLDNVQI